MGRDAADIKPKFIPDEKLLPRDDSGGPDYEPHHGEWDDGGYVKGESKPHLGPGKGKK
jgi:hypothetical protein